MKYVLFLLLGALGLAIGAGFAARIAAGAPGDGPLYSVAALQARLTREPVAWVNRAVRVRAIAYADGCATWGGGELPTCLEWQALLFDSAAQASADAAPQASAPPLALARGPAPPLLAALRRVPFLRWVAPAPQVVHWETVATYRIQLRAVSCRTGGRPP